MLSDCSPDTSLIHSNIKIIPKEFNFDSPKDFIRDIVEIVKTNNFDNTVKVLSEIDILRIENSIRISEIVDQSIKFKHIKLNYQGIYSVEKKKIVAAEALIRLTDNDGNTIYPISFIPMIEQDGRIIELGKLIFENVCDFISRNNLDELGLEYIEVNISPNQIQDPNFVDDYLNLIKKYDINPKYINFEITETSKGTSKACIDKIKKLRELGITFSLDDFGTGNSNLNYIVDMPIDIVKFDKTMVSKYFSNDIASVVVDYSIKMIKGLGYKIVFEGVEQLYEVEKINNMDVDYIQGYYYSKPAVEQEFIERLKEYNKKI
jgi:EAL domain-containing protein (putative c-di-GMP-specific phosphodiesterase class I)